MSSLASRRLGKGGSTQEGDEEVVAKDLEKLELNGHVSDDVCSDPCEVVEMREGFRVKYEDNPPVRVGTESAPPLGHDSESEASLKRYQL